MNCLECDNPVVEFNGLCASCNHEHRKAERESKKVKVVKPIPRVSEEKAKELKEYTKLKKNYLEHKMACEIRLPGCTVSATEIHHAAGRIGKLFLDTNTWKSACHSCHAKIHDVLSAEQNREQGFKI